MIHHKSSHGFTSCGLGIKAKKAKSTSNRAKVTCPHCKRIKQNEPRN